jgi:hypothetical protein
MRLQPLRGPRAHEVRQRPALISGRRIPSS